MGDGLSASMSLTSAVRFFLVLGAWGLASCASQPETGITRVKIYRLDPSSEPETAEPSIAFEQKHYLYGAVSDEDREARRGNYYTVFFRTPDRATPVRARFEYRQSATGFKVHAKETDVDARGGIARFEVTGPEYHERGRLLGWRVRLTQGGQLLGERKSYLWD
jgi:hypothetical protein